MWSPPGSREPARGVRAPQAGPGSGDGPGAGLLAAVVRDRAVTAYPGAA